MTITKEKVIKETILRKIEDMLRNLMTEVPMMEFTRRREATTKVIERILMMVVLTVENEMNGKINMKRKKINQDGIARRETLEIIQMKERNHGREMLLRRKEIHLLGRRWIIIIQVVESSKLMRVS